MQSHQTGDRNTAVGYYAMSADSSGGFNTNLGAYTSFTTDTADHVTAVGYADIQVGDAFTIAGVNEVHLITKQDTGQLKSFRVISVDSSTTMTISPPMITGQGGTDAELQYQNCVINTKASNSALVFLNTTAAAANPFWHKDAIELLPGRYAVPDAAGAAVMRFTTDQGIEIVMTKQFDIDTLKTKFRVDTRFGVCAKQPEMMGLFLFGQA